MIKIQIGMHILRVKAIKQKHLFETKREHALLGGVKQHLNIIPKGGISNKT